VTKSALKAVEKNPPQNISSIAEEKVWLSHRCWLIFLG